ncbi:MAG: outer membrane beta-barrel protein [Gimesia sp.]|nr:outer membrane beta-barrel protein [Gimesia sp.]
MGLFPKTAICCLFLVSVHAAKSQTPELPEPDTDILTSLVDTQAQCNTTDASQCCNSTDCTNQCCEQGRWFLFPQDEETLSIRGWLNGGFIGNTDSPGSKFNGPYNAVDRSNEAMLNQFYLIAEKGLSECNTGLGGRIDLLYGEDFFLAESIGIEKHQDGSGHWNKDYYGLAIPQAYLSYGRKDLSLQLGHFYSVVGYEGLTAPDNFFYSKSYSYQFAGPFTHWGGQVNWNPNDNLTIQAGLHNGWDAFDRVTNRIGFIGKVRYDNHDTGSWASFALTTGDELNDPAGLGIPVDSTNRTRYSLIFSIPLTCNMEYVFHHWLGLQEDGTVTGERADWYGIDQYLYYTVNECWKAGFRFEWFRDEDGTRVGLNRPNNPNVAPYPGNFYSLTFGANWTPTDNFVLRPEIRADWYDGSAAAQPYDDGLKDTQLMIGFDAILMF